MSGLVDSFFGCLPEVALEQYTRRGVSRATIRIDNDRLWPFLERFSVLTQITPEEVDAYVFELEERLSLASVQSYKQTLKTFFNWCVNQGFLQNSPAVHLKPKRRRSARYKAANERDLQVVINGLLGTLNRRKDRRRCVRDLLAFKLALDSGNRLQELARLSTRDMTLALQNPQMATGGVVVYTVPSAPGKKGVVSMRFTEQTAAIYRLWEEIRPGSSRHRIFIALRGKYPGKPLTLNGFTSIFVKRCKQYDVPIYRTHSIRHLKGTKTTDAFNPRVTASLLNISVETAILHYYSEAEQSVLDATAM